VAQKEVIGKNRPCYEKSRGVQNQRHSANLRQIAWKRMEHGLTLLESLFYSGFFGLFLVISEVGSPDYKAKSKHQLPVSCFYVSDAGNESSHFYQLFGNSGFLRKNSWSTSCSGGNVTQYEDKIFGVKIIHSQST